MLRQEQCRVLMDLLKKFQSCRSRLGNTLQRAEQTISEQASYMGKENLQRLTTTVLAGVMMTWQTVCCGVNRVFGKIAICFIQHWMAVFLTWTQMA